MVGLLIECDPSIKSMILKYDEERHDYIVEDLDDENHLVIKESQLQNLKVRLDQVPTAPWLSEGYPRAITDRFARTLTKRSCSWMNPNPNKAVISYFPLKPEAYTRDARPTGHHILKSTTHSPITIFRCLLRKSAS